MAGRAAPAARPPTATFPTQQLGQQAQELDTQVTGCDKVEQITGADLPDSSAPCVAVLRVATQLQSGFDRPGFS